MRIVYWRWLLAVMLVVLGHSAIASVPPGQGYVCRYGTGMSKESACADAAANEPPSGESVAYRFYGISASGFCQIMAQNKDGRDINLMNVPCSTAQVCPENSESVGGECVCKSGYSEQGGQCKSNQSAECGGKAGTFDIVNITSGWKRTPSVGDPSESWVVTNQFPSGGQFSVCSPSTPGGTSGCKQDIDANEPCADCKGWVSQTPGNNGMYRVSTDFRGHYSGESCSTSDSEVAPDLLTPDDSKDPPCPGYVGEVNGVKGCFGNAQKPVPSTDPNKPNNNGSDKGNPPAGNKPSEGEGSGTDGAGRTPSTGTGGSAGGPGGAAGGGTKPDGTTNKPGEGKEQAACGAPGQPPCKIDETGTPKEYKGDGGKGLDKWKADIEANRDQMKESGGGIFDSMNVLFSAPPLASCTPIPLPGGVAYEKQCEVVDTGRAIMAYVWALTAIWLCLGWIREAV